MKKKRNPSDLTGRNERHLKKLIAQQAARIDKLKVVVDGLVRTMNSLLK